MYSQLSLGPSPHSLFSYPPNENGGCACSVSVISTMYTHCRIKAALSYSNSKLKYGSGTQPEVSVTTFTLMLQSQLVVFLLIAQISVQMSLLFFTGSIGRRWRLGLRNPIQLTWLGADLTAALLFV